jgi:TRAP-type transport system periplasmic protein
MAGAGSISAGEEAPAQWLSNDREERMTSTRLAFAVLGGIVMLPAAAANSQTVLNVNAWVPPTHLLVADVTMPFCKDMEQVTAGRVKCNLLPKAVVAPPQTLDAVKDGLADLSFIVHGYTPGRFVLTDVVEFPFMGDTSEAISVAYQRVQERALAKHDEHKGVHVLAVFTHGPGQIYNTKRPVTSLKDLEGLKIRVGGGLVNEVAKALGTVPMLKPAPESYELLSQGVADGLFFPKESPVSFKLVPLIKHVTYVPGGLYNVSFALVMNPTKWNQISEADRTAINKLSGEALARRAGKAWDATDAKGEKAIRDANIPIVIANEQFLAEIKARTAGLEQAWIDKVKAKGVDGAATLAELRKEIAAVAKQH